MKRKAMTTDAVPKPKPKRIREPELDYCDAVRTKDVDGSVIWPAPTYAIEEARAWLREWCV